MVSPMAKPPRHRTRPRNAPSPDECGDRLQKTTRPTKTPLAGTSQGRAIDPQWSFGISRVLNFRSVYDSFKYRSISFVLHISSCRILAKLTNLARWTLLAILQVFGRILSPTNPLFRGIMQFWWEEGAETGIRS